MRNPVSEAKNRIMGLLLSCLVMNVNIAATFAFNGPLRVNPNNPRYFTDEQGQSIYLTGSQTWLCFQDGGHGFPPEPFNYDAFLDFLTDHNHNFFRMWNWEQSRWTLETTDDEYWFFPSPPFKRTGPGLANDGMSRFDLTQLDQAYFDRMRSRVIAAGERGIYVTVQLFNGWSVAKQKGQFGENNPWKGHPFNVNNNINGINGDLDGDNSGEETHELVNNEITKIQEKYVKKVIDTVNDLDNFLYEVSAESHDGATEWQYHIIQFVKSYEKQLPKQHPVGMSVEWPNGKNSELFASDADYITMNGSLDSPPVADGRKVIISDTDHLCGVCGNKEWVWKSFLRGENPVFMDGYDGKGYGVGGEGFDSTDTKWILVRKNLGYTRQFADRVDLNRMQPLPDLASTGYCLANPVADTAEYLAYSTSNDPISINLSATEGELFVEWFDPNNGETEYGAAVQGGASRTFQSPFGHDYVIYLYSAKNPTKVEVGKFSAHYNGPRIVLEWQTERIPDLLGFEILKSSDGRHFMQIGFINVQALSEWPQKFSFVDKNANRMETLYKLRIQCKSGFSYSPIIQTGVSAANILLLEQNYPNPFNDSTTISYYLPSDGNVQLVIYDALGREVATLVNDFQRKGQYTVHFRGGDFSSGIFFISLVQNDFRVIKKIVYLR